MDKMRKFIIFTSALVLAGGVSYAMDEEAMDKEMMMEAPSVTVSGSAELGFQNKDDDNDATEDFSIIREYKVAFSSQGTTDGGLVFGAGININDTEDDDPHKSVGGSNVYIGAADGTWKLKLGGNDPGIEQAGGIGVADDNFHGGDSNDIGVEGAFGGTSYRLTVANPQATEAGDGDWSLGVSHAMGDINVGVGMDSESGLALSVGTDVSGVGLTAYYASSELADVDLEDGYMQPKSLHAPRYDPSTANSDEGKTLRTNINKRYNSYMDSLQTLGKREWTGMGLKASIAAGEGATLSLGYSTSKMEQSENKAAALDRILIDGEVEGDQSSTQAIAAGTPPKLGTSSATQAGYVAADSANLYALRTKAAEDWSGTAKTSLIELEFAYDLGGGAKLIAGIDKKTSEAIMLTEASHKKDDAGSYDFSGTESEEEVVTYSTSVEETDTTTLELKLAFTF